MAKALLPSQCDILHQYYPPAECCICTARKEIDELKTEIKRLKRKPRRKTVLL